MMQGQLLQLVLMSTSEKESRRNSKALEVINIEKTF